MDKISILALDSQNTLSEIKKVSAFAARLTQRGHKLTNVSDVEELLAKPVTDETFTTFMDMPHPTLQKFAVINYLVIGASRRFLAQVTRHQNEVKFMSGSLQYSDYSKDDASVNFVVPYELLAKDATGARSTYLNMCERAMQTYNDLRAAGIDNDTCGYLAPQGLRNVLLISATPFQWKHMIKQRICRRNTPETRYVFLKIWEDLFNKKDGELLFAPRDTAPMCCPEGKMTCGVPITITDKDGHLIPPTPNQILAEDFPLLCEEEN